ncbi:tRNA pseudouridine(13) synthase TruD [Alteromonas flava]|uniref:tRNA pseudouridine(13) synthase TruD n=1 Tax=Alteromonas flava TaxID=2048003 RepID=UPI000C2918AF|nr:tRNA pseudouridine(13) synthase TruD [Alteromonas flava]
MSLTLATDWYYLHGKPQASARFKAIADDFIVTEELGYATSGEGEHIFLWVEKQDLNTAFVAEALAKFTGLPLRAVSYAGRKDKFALTQQWFGVHMPGNQQLDWSAFSLPGARILDNQRHHKKLRTGQLKGNRFTIRLRDLTDMPWALERAALIKAYGAPNYFAEQRFGVVRGSDGQLHTGGNLAMAQRMMDGETIRNRNKRSMAISALRSWLFNHVVSARINADCYDEILAGDAMQLSGSNSFFIVPAVDETLRQRLSEGDIAITAPLAGKGKWLTQDAAEEFEQQSCRNFQPVLDTLTALDLKQERRAISLRPENFEWDVDGNDLCLQLSLPAGCYATAVIRELVNVEEG